MPHGGSVRVSVHREGLQAVILIVDSGAGMPAEAMRRLGQRGATFNKEGGSGLGLYQVKETLE